MIVSLYVWEGMVGVSKLIRRNRKGGELTASLSIPPRAVRDERTTRLELANVFLCLWELWILAEHLKIDTVRNKTGYDPQAIVKAPLVTHPHIASGSNGASEIITSSHGDDRPTIA
jgi:hypothetical protein